MFLLSFKIHFEFTHSIVNKRLREKKMIYITELVFFGLQFPTLGGVRLNGGPKAQMLCIPVPPIIYVTFTKKGRFLKISASSRFD